jgi:hypothetical protein
MLNEFLDLCEPPIAGYIFLGCIALLAVIVLVDMARWR